MRCSNEEPIYPWETNYLYQEAGLMKDTKQGVLVEAWFDVSAEWQSSRCSVAILLLDRVVLMRYKNRIIS